MCINLCFRLACQSIGSISMTSCNVGSRTSDHHQRRSSSGFITDSNRSIMRSNLHSTNSLRGSHQRLANFSLFGNSSSRSSLRRLGHFTSRSTPNVNVGFHEDEEDNEAHALLGRHSGTDTANHQDTRNSTSYDQSCTSRVGGNFVSASTASISNSLMHSFV